MFLSSILSDNCFEVECTHLKTMYIFLYLDAINSNASSGQFTTLVTLAMGMVTPLNSLGGFLRLVMTNAGSILAIEELLRQGAKLKDSQSPSGANCHVDVLKNGLVVANVEFAYPRSEALVLNGVDFTVRVGTYVALCGESGSGKSTLLEILMQNRVASGGKIEWDGTDIEKDATNNLSCRKQCVNVSAQN